MGFRIKQLSGGMIEGNRLGVQMVGNGVGLMGPAVAKSLPPYQVESLLRTSWYQGAPGTPIR